MSRMIQIVFKTESRSRGTIYLLFFRGGLFTMIARLCQLFEFYCASRLAWLVNCCNCFFLSFLFFQYTFSLSCACVHSQQQRLYEFFFSIGPLQAMGNTIFIQLSRLSKLYVSKCSDHQRSVLTVWETLLEDELYWKRSHRIASYSRYSFFSAEASLCKYSRDPFELQLLPGQRGSMQQIQHNTGLQFVPKILGGIDQFPTMPERSIHLLWSS